MMRSAHSMCSVPERRTRPSICRTSTTLKVSSVPCIGERSVYSPTMRVDLHTHTAPASSCSRIDHASFVSGCHAPVSGRGAHQPRQHAPTTSCSSPPARRRHHARPRGRDLDALRRLHHLLARPRVPVPLQRRPGLSATRRHTRVGRPRLGAPRRRRWPQRLELLSPAWPTTVAPLLDGVEVYNGNWTGEPLRADRARHRRRLRHRRDRRQRCPRGPPHRALHDRDAGAIDSTADVVRAIRERATTPVTEVSRRRRLRPVLRRLTRRPTRRGGR